jgi:hypothetical protein
LIVTLRGRGIMLVISNRMIIRFVMLSFPMRCVEVGQPSAGARDKFGLALSRRWLTLPQFPSAA